MTDLRGEGLEVIYSGRI